MSENKRIFNNTIFLYVRMIFVIFLTLFSLKLLYQSLGIENFGILNLVTGFVLLFSFLSSAMRNGTQRFLNVAYASGDINKVKKTFSISFNVHLVISLILFFLAETLGIWFLNNYLNIPKNMFFEAQVIYHLAVLSLVFGIMAVPYQAILIAKEKMTLYAYLSVFEAVLKFFAALLVVVVNEYLLIYYGLALFLTSVLMFVLYYIVVGRKYNITYSLGSDIKLARDIVNFSKWNILGQISAVTSNHGNTIIFNVFFGVVANASFAISQQINALLNNLVSNLQTAFNPQIVESYVKGNVERHINLVLVASRYSLYLIVCMSIPFLISIEFILKMWLGNELPQYTLTFSKIVILVAMIESVSGSLWMSAHARGNIRNYQIFISIILLLNLPLSYFIIKIYGTAEQAILSTIFISVLAFFYRFYYFKKGMLLSLDNPILMNYLKNLMFVFVFVFVLFNYCARLNVSEISTFIFVNVIIEFIFLMYLLIFCIPNYEIKKVYNLVKVKLTSSK